MKLFKRAGGTLRPHGRLVAEKIPRGQLGATEARVADDSAASRSSSANVVGDLTNFTLAGQPPRNKEGGLLPARFVVEALNLAGSRGTPLLVSGDARPERGVDAMAMDPEGKQLLLQITRPEEHRIWKLLGRLRVATGSRTPEEHADVLWAAAEHERTRADPRIVLVLDATAPRNWRSRAWSKLPPAIRRARRPTGIPRGVAGGVHRRNDRPP